LVSSLLFWPKLKKLLSRKRGNRRVPVWWGSYIPWKRHVQRKSVFQKNVRWCKVAYTHATEHRNVTSPRNNFFLLGIENTVFSRLRRNVVKTIIESSFNFQNYVHIWRTQNSIVMKLGCSLCNTGWSYSLESRCTEKTPRNKKWPQLTKWIKEVTFIIQKEVKKQSSF
jgi:Pyruvate/2-oxoacid:ferredoxin oxidoreductase delta subunit